MSKKITLLSLLLVLPVSLLAMEQGFSSLRVSNQFVVDLVKSTFRSKLENNVFDFERSLEELKEEVSGNILDDWQNVEKAYMQKSGNISCPVTDDTSIPITHNFQLASGSDDKTIKIWDPNTGNCLRTLSGHSRGVLTVAYSPDGSHLASGSSDNTIKIWDPNTGDCFQMLTKSYDEILKLNPCNCTRRLDLIFEVAYSPNGVLASGGYIQYQKLSGTRVSSAWGSGEVRIWDKNTGGCLETLSCQGPVHAIAYSPDNCQLASGENVVPGIIKVWDPNTNGCLRTLTGDGDRFYALAYSPDGTQLASGSFVPGTIKIWDPGTGDCFRTLGGGGNSINSVVYSPDGTQLASGSDDKTVKIWDPNAGVCLLTLEGHGARVFSVAYSLDGSQLASGSQDKTIKIWDPNAGVCLWTLEGHQANVRAVAYSPAVSQRGSSRADDIGQSSQEMMPHERFERSLLIYASELLKEKRCKKYSLAAKLFACSSFETLKEEEQKQLWDSVGE